MGIGERSDPVLAHNFEISLLDSSSSLGEAVTTVTLSSVIDEPAGGFSECTGLEATLDVEEYQEGGNNGAVLKFPTRVKWNPITLKKGLTMGTELWDWFFGFVEGAGQRKDGLITLRDAQHAPHTVWGFRRGLPVRYQGPALSAAKSEAAIEAIEIAHEGVYQLGGASELVAAVSGAIDALTG